MFSCYYVRSFTYMSILWWGNHFHTYIYFFYYYFSGWQKSIYGAKYTFLKGYIISIIQPLENILPYRKLRYCDSKKKKKNFLRISIRFMTPETQNISVCMYVDVCMTTPDRRNRRFGWFLELIFRTNWCTHSIGCHTTLKNSIVIERWSAR